MSETPPSQLGRYELIRRLAVGGMGEIYLARLKGAANFEKRFVIKRILPHLARQPEFVTKFVDEANILVHLTHGNIVPVFEMGEAASGELYMAMEYIPGSDLRSVLRALSARKRRMSAPLCVFIAAEVCKGLSYAHNKGDEQGRPLGIIHRDISPSNILISREGEVKLVDFGIAKATVRNTESVAGQLQGKFCYMSPEQAIGAPLDARSDLFSTGVVLYEMLTGERPFEGDNDLDTLQRVRHHTPPPPSTLRSDVDPALDDLVTRLLAREPQDRPASAEALLDALVGVLMRQTMPVTALSLRRELDDLIEPPATESQPPGALRLDEALDLEADRLLGAAPRATGTLSLAPRPARGATPWPEPGAQGATPWPEPGAQGATPWPGPGAQGATPWPEPGASNRGVRGLDPTRTGPISGEHGPDLRAVSATARTTPASGEDAVSLRARGRGEGALATPAASVIVGDAGPASSQPRILSRLSTLSAGERAEAPSGFEQTDELPRITPEMLRDYGARDAASSPPDTPSTPPTPVVPLLPAPQRRRGLSLVLVLLLLLIIAGALYWWLRLRPATLTIDVDVDGAQVKIDGVRMGEAPLTLGLDPNRAYRVEVIHPEHRAAVAVITPEAGERRQLALDLEPLPLEPAPAPEPAPVEPDGPDEPVDPSVRLRFALTPPDASIVVQRGDLQLLAIDGEGEGATFPATLGDHLRVAVTPSSARPAAWQPCSFTLILGEARTHYPTVTSVEGGCTSIVSGVPRGPDDVLGLRVRLEAAPEVEDADGEADGEADGAADGATDGRVVVSPNPTPRPPRRPREVTFSITSTRDARLAVSGESPRDIKAGEAVEYVFKEGEDARSARISPVAGDHPYASARLRLNPQNPGADPRCEVAGRGSVRCAVSFADYVLLLGRTHIGDGPESGTRNCEVTLDRERLSHNNPYRVFIDPSRTYELSARGCHGAPELRGSQDVHCTADCVRNLPLKPQG